MPAAVLGVDIGTGSSKGVLTTLDGRVLARASRRHRTDNPRPGYVEHDADAVWWADFRAIARELTDRAADPADVAPAPAPAPSPVPPRPAAGAGGRRKKFVLPVVGLLVAGAGVWGAKQYTYGRAHESTDNAQVDGHIVPVLAKVGGYVRAVNVGENQPVQEGQAIVQIDDAELRVRLAQIASQIVVGFLKVGQRLVKLHQQHVDRGVFFLFQQIPIAGTARGPHQLGSQARQLGTDTFHQRAQADATAA